tara:strand:- start:1502 stop:1975 length:474 start_codon:yes stop_codon:yes gene_type:complete
MSNCKPQEALQLGLNVLIDKSCGGYNCNWHEFPYEIDSIVSGDGRKKIKFNDIDDVWKYITLLRLESEEHQKKGSSFSTLNNIWEQLPFFVCTNHLINKKALKDISRYAYTKDTNTPPYSGSYGDIPHIWVQKHYIIKQAMMLRDNKLRQKAKDGNK